MINNLTGESQAAGDTSQSSTSSSKKRKVSFGGRESTEEEGNDSNFQTQISLGSQDTAEKSSESQDGWSDVSSIVESEEEEEFSPLQKRPVQI